MGSKMRGAQFLTEARLLARCHHPGVVTVHTAFEDNGTAYMVMELLCGQSLMARLDARGGKLSEAEALLPIERVGEALSYVHDQGLLHRDIKPDNIILCDDGRAMLIDFGTAREYAQGQSLGHTVAVTPGYAPLEQYARQAKRGAFTDVYGLAATLYHLLTGSPPPAASDRAMGILLRPVRDENPLVSPAVARAVEAALQMEIARRPQSVREFLELLHAPVNAADAQFTQTPKRVHTSTSLDEEIEKFWSPSSPSTSSPASTPTSTPAPFPPVALKPHEGAPPVPLPRLDTPSMPMTPRPVSPVAPPLDSTITSMKNASGGGIGTRHASSGEWQGWAWAISIIFFFVMCFLLMSVPKHSTDISYPNISTSPSYFPPNFVPPSSPSGSGAYVPPVASVAPSVSESDISPSSVQALPVSPQPAARQGISAPSFFPNGWAEFSPDGKWLAYKDEQNAVRVWDVVHRRLRCLVPQTENKPLWRLSFSPDGQLLALEQKETEGQASASSISVWNLTQSKMIGTMSVNPTTKCVAVTALRSPGEVLVFQWPIGVSGTDTASSSRSLFRWNPRTGQKSSTPFQVTDALRYLVLSPDGKEFVAGDGTGRIRWVDARTGKQKAQQNITATSQPVQQIPASSQSTFPQLQPRAFCVEIGLFLERLVFGQRKPQADWHLRPKQTKNCDH